MIPADSFTVFGYGSLVNTGTHAGVIAPGTLLGWRRVWREVAGWPYAVLSIQAAPGAHLQGVALTTPRADQAALDVRESCYVRTTARYRDAGAGAEADIEVYFVRDHLARSTKPILRSYLDVVLTGYEDLFGADSLAGFYATTDDWHVGVFDDRASPRYARHQPQTYNRAARYDALHAQFSNDV